MKLIQKVVLIVAAVGMLHSCTLYKEVEVLEVHNVEVKEFSQELVEVEVELLVDNPNWYNIKIVKSDLDLLLNSKDIGTLQLAKKVVVPKKAKSIQKISVYTDYDDLKENFLKNVLTLLFARKTEFQATGYVKAKGLFIAKKVPVDVKQEIDLTEFEF
jgi:LEA14-like dessication related protein